MKLKINILKSLNNSYEYIKKNPLHYIIQTLNSVEDVIDEAIN